MGLRRDRVSVIIPTYNRSASLRRTLDSLAQQTYPAHAWEVVVVDDGSTDETRAVAQDTFPFALRYVYQENQGDHVARNRGAQASTGGVLVFLDDDLVVVRRYVSILVEKHRTYDRLVALGTLRPFPADDESVFQKVYSSYSDTSGAGGQPACFLDCMCGILSVKRHHFFEIGQMQLLPGGVRNKWGGIDFGYRAHQMGFRFERCQGAVAYHDDWVSRDLTTKSHRWRGVAKVAPLLFHKYPELQSQIPLFRDKVPIAIGHDSATLMIHKAFHLATAWRPVQWGMEALSALLERVAPWPPLLARLYRWTISSYIYRGYREGLRQYGPVPTSADEDVQRHA